MMLTRQDITARNSRTISVTLLVVTAAVLGVWITLSQPWHDQRIDIPPDLQGTLNLKPQPLTAFELTDQHRRTFNLDRLNGKWTFMFFGYTRCPDICPTTMTVMKNIATVLERDPRQIESQFVFVSMDPERDDLASLGGYVEYFKPGFIGITGSQAQLQDLGRQLNINVRRLKEETSMNYLLSHTSSVMLIDPRARWYAAFSPPHERASVIQRFYASYHFYQQETQ